MKSVNTNSSFYN